MSASGTARQRPVVVSIGADIDAAVLEAEIRAEVERKKREGVYDPELLMGIAPDSLRDRMDALRGSADLTYTPPIHSSRPGLGPVVAAAKRAVARALRWHTRWLVGQVQTLGGSTVAALAAMTERLEETQRQVNRLSEEVGRLHAAQVAGLPGSLPAASWAEALSDAANLRELSHRPEMGRIACVYCGDGRMLAALKDTGAPCYGVEPDVQRARSCAELGLEVCVEDVFEHLAALPPESLAGIVIESAHRLGAEPMDELLCLASAALLPGAPLILEVETAGNPEDGRRVLDLPLEFLAEEAGFRTVSVRRTRRAAVADGGLSDRLATLERAVYGAAAHVVARR